MPLLMAALVTVFKPTSKNSNITMTAVTLGLNIFRSVMLCKLAENSAVAEWHVMANTIVLML